MSRQDKNRTSRHCTNLWSQVKLVEWDKVALQKSRQKTEINSVSKLGIQIVNLQVQLVQVLVHERHQGFLHHLCRMKNNQV